MMVAELSGMICQPGISMSSRHCYLLLPELFGNVVEVSNLFSDVESHLCLLIDVWCLCRVVHLLCAFHE